MEARSHYPINMNVSEDIVKNRIGSYFVEGTIDAKTIQYFLKIFYSIQ